MTIDSNPPAAIDPLVLTARATSAQRFGAVALDLVVPSLIAFAAAALFALHVPAGGWALVAAALAVIVLDLRILALSGRSIGDRAAGTRTVVAATGLSAGASVFPAMLSGRLTSVDLRRGRDPLAPALSPFVFPSAAERPVTGPVRLTGQTAIVVLDSGERLSLHSALVLGRIPSAPEDAPAAVYQWADLSRTLSKSHARLEWDGRTVWVTDLGSTNGTALRTASGPQPLLPFQRTPVPMGVDLELGDRIVSVGAPT
ncbi:hypothetical protein GCM10009775_14820 [Microbacterium aoyamense]|uniref:FHA domain-containing protein n=1 Tax=Microbacterium aoyamense TaxID=344166 RepID=A0ABN2PN17_9MICO|nr:FHA domain-containing protein [Microbacterium aoyamense]